MKLCAYVELHAMCDGAFINRITRIVKVLSSN